jgi:hypothetical protein
MAENLLQKYILGQGTIFVTAQMMSKPARGISKQTIPTQYREEQAFNGQTDKQRME